MKIAFMTPMADKIRPVPRSAQASES